MRVLPGDSRLAYLGAVAVEHTPGWSRAWRLPFAERELFFAKTLVERAGMSAGVRLAFRSDTTMVAGRFEADPELTKLDVCCDGDLIATCDLRDEDGFRVEGLPAGEKRCELWLPQYGAFRLRHLELSDGAALARPDHAAPRWLTYGSSITQCKAAASPTRTWPAIVARSLGLDLTCLGFSGQCHLDPAVARVMRDLPAEMISICAGINIYGAASLNARSFAPALAGFLTTLRDGHPDTPLVVVSPIYAPEREATPNAVGLDLRQIRGLVENVIRTLRSHGDTRLHYVDGLELFGADQGALLPDGLHPDAEGYLLIGKRFAEQVARRYFPLPVG